MFSQLILAGECFNHYKTAGEWASYYIDECASHCMTACECYSLHVSVLIIKGECAGLYTNAGKCASPKITADECSSLQVSVLVTTLLQVSACHYR